jgi:tocopherol cyclase
MLPVTSSSSDRYMPPPPYPLDDNGRPIDIKSNQQLLNGLQTPHSGRKFTPTHPSSSSSSSSRLSRVRSKISRLLRRNNRRFTEGWYYRLTLPEYNESFVFIFSIEDAGRFIKGEKSPLTLACMQLLGPDDTYLVQSDEDDTKFWGWKYAQGLGCTFEWKEDDDDVDDNNDDTSAKRSIAAMTSEEWRDRVQTGFQILPFHLQGRLDGHDGSMGGVKSNQGIRGNAEYDIRLRPVAGWGQYPSLSNDESSSSQTYHQFSTAGWLAKFPVFEPHWQITMAHARATGSLNWNGTVYEFEDAPFYGEKNWGGAFPTKWYWSQCNSFDDYPDLSFTAGGGIRILPFSFLPGKRTETLGLIGIHHDGNFYEFVPWTSHSEWEVDPWGVWKFRGRCTDNKRGQKFEADIVVTTGGDVPGVLLRAPTKDEGMQYFCRDSGFGQVTLSLWELEWDSKSCEYIRSPNKPPLIDKATSHQCTVEVGGGPWWSTWKVNSQMSPFLKKLIRLPYIFRQS